MIFNSEIICRRTGAHIRCIGGGFRRILPEMGKSCFISVDQGLFVKLKSKSIINLAKNKDQQTQKTKGFGFVTFESPAAASTCLAHLAHAIEGKSISVKVC